MITICHENQHLHLRGGASAREDSASPREDKILPGTCISFLQRWGSSIDETPPLIITNHPPYHLQLHWWPSFSLAHRFASFLDHTPPLNLHHCKWKGGWFVMISGGVLSKKLMQVLGRILSSLALAESSLALAPPPRWRWWFSIVYITHTPTHPLHTVMYTIKYSMGGDILWMWNLWLNIFKCVYHGSLEPDVDKLVEGTEILVLPFEYRLSPSIEDFHSGALPCHVNPRFQQKGSETQCQHFSS